VDVFYFSISADEPNDQSSEKRLYTPKTCCLEGISFHRHGLLSALQTYGPIFSVQQNHNVCAQSRGLHYRCFVEPSVCLQRLAPVREMSPRSSHIGASSLCRCLSGKSCSTYFLSCSSSHLFEQTKLDPSDYRPAFQVVRSSISCNGRFRIRNSFGPC
jgi:hypothetical protein